jgi:hypothetical protein
VFREVIAVKTGRIGSLEELEALLGDLHQGY